MCPAGNGRVVELAEELKRLTSDFFNDFPECPRTEYQRGRYPFVLERYERVKEIGFEGHLKEERERAEAGTLLNDIRKY
jgi:hypothetical protein